MNKETPFTAAFRSGVIKRLREDDNKKALSTIAKCGVNMIIATCPYIEEDDIQSWFNQYNSGYKQANELFPKKEETS